MARKKKESKRRKHDLAYRARKPWVEHICWAKRRVTSDDPRWKSHHGVPHTLTVDEGEELWLRDDAANMKRPSLDRIDPKKGYTKDNCRFMEWLENVRLPHEGKPKDPDPEFT